MKPSRSWCILSVALLLAQSASGQWKNVAPNLLDGTGFYGAMQFRDGIVWAGAESLWSSTDLGATWRQSVNFANAEINDIAFFDRRNGLVATQRDGVFHTTDGGLSWQRVLPPGSFPKVGFNGSAKIMHALDFSGIFYTSTDGGGNWVKSNVSGGEARSFAIAPDRTIYVQLSQDYSNPYTGKVFISKDLGRTWQPGAGIVDGDSYTVSADSCDPNRLCLVNEQIFNPSDGNAKLYLSADGGASWVTTASHPTLFYSGTLTTTSDAIFAGTLDTDYSAKYGIVRSTDRGITWQSIGGPGVASDTRNIAAMNRNVVFAADPSGSIWLTTNGGGDSAKSAPLGSLALTPKSLFGRDTLTCDSIFREVAIARFGCPEPSIISSMIVGKDSQDYRIDSVGYDSIYLALQPRGTGLRSGMLVINLSDGSSDTLALNGFVLPYSGSATLSTNSLFESDTLHCDSLTLPVYITSTGCRPPLPIRFVISGPDSNGYRILDSAADSISIEWNPQTSGAQTATLFALLADGQLDSVALGGYSASPPFVYSFSPQSLFIGDSLYVDCASGLDTISIACEACRWPQVKSQRIVGADSQDYAIADPPPSPLSALDSISILFTPSDTGIRFAQYELTLDNDSVISIPLHGVGRGIHSLSLNAGSLGQKTDTIGGNVAVPIVIGGLPSSETIELVLHYPLPDLVYDGSFDANGMKVDMPGEQWPGRSKLQIAGDESNPTQAYARFNVFSDTAYDPLVVFDSMSIPDAPSPCGYEFPPASRSAIYPPQGCGIQILSRWVHFGERPVLDVRPNPTSGEINLTASADLGDAVVTIYDMLGVVRGCARVTLKQGQSSELQLPPAAGLYYLRVASSSGSENLQVIVEH